VWCDSYMGETWRIRMCDKTIWYAVDVCVCDVCVCVDEVLGVIRFKNNMQKEHSHVWHDSYSLVTWRIRMSHMTIRYPVDVCVCVCDVCVCVDEVLGFIRCQYNIRKKHSLLWELLSRNTPRVSAPIQEHSLECVPFWIYDLKQTICVSTIRFF